MKKAVVVGSGAGGATVAKELQGSFDVTVLEAGRSFQPFTGSLALVEKVKKTGLLFDERLIQILFRAMQVRKCGDDMVLVNGVGHGGTTTISAGNAVRMDGDLKAIGIELDTEFQELFKDIPVSTGHQGGWHDHTREAFEICRELEFGPVPTPKMAHAGRCTGCGRCVLGCPTGAKWDSRSFLHEAMEAGARLISGCKAQKVVIEGGRATGVVATVSRRTEFYPADLVILAAGGFGTPVVLQNSGIGCQPRLFVDPVLCVAAKMPGSRQDRELPMPFIIQREQYIISPYFDYLSFFFNRDWKHPSGDIFSLMIKLADTTTGTVSAGGVDKSLTTTDKKALAEAVELCKSVFRKMGVKDESLFLGTLNAGHPGGMLPLTENESQTFHHESLPENLYVADATLFPHSLGNPPILTIAAMAKKIGKLCKKFE